jgi:hypothetical protein
MSLLLVYANLANRPATFQHANQWITFKIQQDTIMGYLDSISKCLPRKLTPALLLASFIAHAQTAPPRPPIPLPISRDQVLWRTTITKIPVSAKGCYQATYPSLQWQSVPCVIAPIIGAKTPRHHIPITSRIVGNTFGDIAATVPSTGTISFSQGWFENVTVAPEADSASNKANGFSLQLNTNYFTTPVCNNAPLPQSPTVVCQGWEQFVLSNDTTKTKAYVYIQSWVVNYGRPCPTGWLTPPPDPEDPAVNNDCLRNSSAAVLPIQKV